MSYSTAYDTGFDVASSSSSWPAPPCQSVWWDEAETQANVLATLRLRDIDIDADAIRRLIPAAGWHINAYLDRTDCIEAPAPPPLQAALELVVISMYHRQGNVATLGAGVTSLQRPRPDPYDPLTDVYAELAPWRQRWANG